MVISLQFQQSPVISTLFEELMDRTKLNRAIGTGVGKLTKNHLTQRNEEAIARTEQRYAGTVGALKHTQYWAHRASGTTSQGDANVARVIIPLGNTTDNKEGSEAFARLFGDVTIKPVNSKYLAIPAQAMSYNKRAREFPDLKFIPYGNGTKALAQVTGKGKDRKVVPLYWLLTSVTLKKDATILPTDAQYLDAATAAVDNYLEPFLAG